jgi:hypothetical protein
MNTKKRLSLITALSDSAFLKLAERNTPLVRSMGAKVEVLSSLSPLVDVYEIDQVQSHSQSQPKGAQFTFKSDTQRKVLPERNTLLRAQPGGLPTSSPGPNAGQTFRPTSGIGRETNGSASTRERRIQVESMLS